MIKSIYSLLIGVTSACFALSCDVCGTAVSIPGSDALPGIYSNYLGLHGSFRRFETRHIPLLNEPSWLSQESFSSMELHGRYSPIRRLQFIANIPIHHIDKTEQGIREQIAGIGDISIRTNFLLVDKVDEQAKKVVNLFGGVTVKLPTGKYDLGPTTLYYPENIRPGTGTFDFSFHLDFILRHSTWGLVMNQAYSLRGSQSNFYQFGDIFQQTVTGFYFHETSKHQLMIELGLQNLWMNKDWDRIASINNPYSGGVSIAPLIRPSYFYQEWIFNAALSMPIYQNLADNNVRQFFAWRLGAIFQIKNK
jgi:hypothetical protein